MNQQDIETEVKFRILNSSAIEGRLITLGAILEHPKILETNLRLDTPDLSLKRNKQVLRLRRDNKVKLAFKGPAKWSNGVSSREEYEFSVGDYETAKKFVNALGYQSQVIYEKYRTTYLLNGLMITIDELPYGLFIEIEGADAEAIKNCGNDLKLNWENRLEDSYLSLFDRTKKSHGLPFRDLTFENFINLTIDLDSLGILPADK